MIFFAHLLDSLKDSDFNPPKKMERVDPFEPDVLREVFSPYRFDDLRNCSLHYWHDSFYAVGCDMRGSSLRVTSKDISINQCDLTGATLNLARSHSGYRFLHVKKSVLKGCEIRTPANSPLKFFQCDLTGADFSQVNVSEMLFDGCIVDIEESYTGATLINCRYSDPLLCDIVRI